MHLLAGVLLVVEVALSFGLEKILSVRALDWIGALMWFLGMALILLSIVTLRRRGGVPDGKSFVNTSSVVTDGIFGIVRHPLYLGWSLMYLVPLLFNPRWELAFLAAAGIASVQVFTRQEEKILLDEYGDSYQTYAALVPRMDLVKGLWRAIRRRRTT
jgi:protein-S-isoprenylcysteine O-methyltransferase Ste14